MTREKVAEDYLTYLGNGETDKVIGLFTENGIVESPLYGTLPAKAFYAKLMSDTRDSVLEKDGLFFEENPNRMVLLFNYKWTLKDGKIVSFKVADIITLNEAYKIEKLIIIYDTVHSRNAVAKLTGKDPDN